MPNNLKKIGKVWYSDYSVFVNGKRKRIKHALSTDKEVAQIKIADLLKVRRAEKHGHTPQDVSWNYFKEKYMEYSKGKNKQTHYRDTIAFRYLEEQFIPTQLSDFTPMVMESLKARLKAAGKGDWNINRIISALKAAMHKAEAWGLIPPQLWRSVKPYKTPRGRLLFWRPADQSQILEECDGAWKTMAFLGMYAGLRREEIQTLQWLNVDFARNRIHIVGNDEWAPKGYERRWVPMKKILCAHLESMAKKDGYVLGKDRPSLGVMTAYFSRIVRRSGNKGSLHTARHTYAADLAMSGIPLAIIQERMGHSSIKTTQVYAHLCPEAMAEKWPA